MTPHGICTFSYPLRVFLPTTLSPLLSHPIDTQCRLRTMDEGTHVNSVRIPPPTGMKAARVLGESVRLDSQSGEG